MTIRILQGDALTLLRTMPSESVHCVVTSPPYFGLRAYLPRGHTDKHLEIGSESTPAEFIARLVEVFREVKRVLRPDGTCWVNIGDSYNNFRSTKGPGQAIHGRDKLNGKPAPDSGPRGHACAKEKDLLGMPWLLAFALRDDGWYLRSALPWVKRSCMPESCRDRPTSAIEYVFMLTKGARYYWDAEAVRQRDQGKSSGNSARKERGVSHTGPESWSAGEAAGIPWEAGTGRNFRNSDLFFASLEDAPRQFSPYRGRSTKDHDAAGVQNASDVKRRTLAAMAARGVDGNKVAPAPEPHGLICNADGDPLALDVNPAPFKGSHFATFPPKLVEPLIKAGTSERGCCPKCGAPWARIIEHQIVPGPKAVRTVVVDARDYSADANDQGSNRQKDGHKAGYRSRNTTIGWRPTCSCPSADPVPCTVLDCFSGAGTTLLVADRLQRRAIGIDLHPQYNEMASERVAADAPLLAEIKG